MPVSLAPRPPAEERAAGGDAPPGGVPAAGVDDLVKLCARVCAVSGCAVALLDPERACFASFLGVTPELGAKLGGLAEHVGFDAPLVLVEDARRAPTLAAIPAVREDLVRFLAGAPLRGDDGSPLGALLIFDEQPLAPGAEPPRFLEAFAAQVQSRISLQRRLSLLDDARAAQLAAEQVLRGSLGAAISLAILVTTRDGVVVLTNGGAERMLGIGAEAVKGRASLAQFFAAPEPGASFEALVAQAADGRPLELERAMRRVDGTTFPAAVVVQPTLDALGAVTGYVVAARDLTESRAATRIKDDFLAAVSHELRTPLTSILGSLGLLAAGLGGEMPPEGAELVQLARANGLRLLRLVSDLLDFQKLSAGSAPLALAPHRVGDLLRRAGELACGSASAAEEAIELHRAGLDARVTVDLEAMARALANLLENGLKFSGPGLRVTVIVEAGPRRVRMTIRDRGPGVPEAFRPRLFSSFAQADSGDTRSTGSTGLGLSIAKTIVDRHRGTIGLDAEKAPGASFYIELDRSGPEP